MNKYTVYFCRIILALFIMVGCPVSIYSTWYLAYQTGGLLVHLQTFCFSCISIVGIGAITMVALNGDGE
jgi:hypothetical protein